MKNFVRADNPILNERLSGNEQALPLPSLWFANEDIYEEDQTLLTGLLRSSFQDWLNESAGSPFLDGFLLLTDPRGQIIAASDQANPDQFISHDLRQLAEEASIKRKSLISGGILVVPLLKKKNEDCLAVLLANNLSPAQNFAALLETAALHFRVLFYSHLERVFVQNLLIRQQSSEKEAFRRDTLFQTAKRLHDQNEVTSVLNVLLVDVENLYPHAEVDLYLSQDHVNGDPRVKPLMLRHSAADLYAQAFLEGKPVMEYEDDALFKLAIPMSGKQAVYGVLSVTMKKKYLEDSDIGALVMLCDTAGSAFENAKLFEQSNLLIGELQLINELTKRLNQSLHLKEIFQFAMSELLHIFKADYCNVLQLNNETNVFKMMASNLPSAANEIYSTSHGFCGIVYETKEPLIISDYQSTPVVSSKLMDGTGSRSLIAAPIMANTEVVGVIMVTHKSPNYFSYDNYKLLQVLSIHIGLAVTNASLHAEVRRMVITDNLTGLRARHYLNEQIQARQRKDKCGSLVLVDIDYFKKVNDTYGHQIGDRILISVSEVIRSCIRESDIAARWGGEELAVYLPQIRSE
ncbi:sensor domain-containing diguanylate cyclase, partial [Paenibacillus sepulcri]|nr:sensor domain-containing diguanylate cyclase [Paenibacillus sepulcri]